MGCGDPRRKACIRRGDPPGGREVVSTCSSTSATAPPTRTSRASRSCSPSNAASYPSPAPPPISTSRLAQQMKAACQPRGHRHAPARPRPHIRGRGTRGLDPQFPLFVKHYSSYASVDLSRNSRVPTPAGLKRQARKIMSRHGAALIEEYIAGTECTVLVAENPGDARGPKTYVPCSTPFPRARVQARQDEVGRLRRLSFLPVNDPLLAAQAARHLGPLLRAPRRRQLRPLRPPGRPEGRP